LQDVLGRFSQKNRGSATGVELLGIAIFMDRLTVFIRLREFGLILYSRRNVTIVNRQKLEQAACNCYKVIEQQKKK